MASKTEQGFVYVTLCGEEIALKPTPRAAFTLSRVFDGLAAVRGALGRSNLDAAVGVIRIGANMSDREAKNLDERVFDEMGREPGAAAALFLQLHRYVSVLENGGRPLPDEVERVYDGSADEDARGNS